MFPQFEYEYVTYEELYDAYEECRRHKWKTTNAAAFQVNLSENLYRLWVDLNKGYYKIGKSIAFIVDKPVKREVFAADFRDRIVHHLVIRRLINTFEEEMIESSFSCRKGKGTLYGVKTLASHMKEISNNYTKETYVLKCDIKSFFMSINKELLFEKVNNLIENSLREWDKKDVDFTKNIVKMIIKNNPQDGCVIKQHITKWNELPKDKSLFNTPKTHGIPIGNLTSQIFANYLLNDFDRYIIDELGFKYYGRYVDDFYILSNDKEKLINVISKLKGKLEEIGIQLHPKKVYLQNIEKGVKFIGGVVKPNRIYISKRTVGNLKYYLNKTKLLFDNIVVTKENVEKLICSFNSYMGFLKHYSTYNIRKKIIESNLVSIFRKYCYFSIDLLKMIPFKEYSYYEE